jgi:hypothetical protein
LPLHGTIHQYQQIPLKSQNISAVMVFRRSLVRELTATAVGLFLVLLESCSRIWFALARAAGGTVGPEEFSRFLALTHFFSIFCFRSRSSSPFTDLVAGVSR